MTLGPSRHFRLLAAFALAMCLACSLRAGGDEVKVQAQLIWGTDLAKSSSQEHKPIDAKTGDDLRKVFKWKNYFVINTQLISLKRNKQEQLKMSDKCALKIKSLGGDRLEVEVYGMGKFVCKGTQDLPKDEKWFLMGLAENESSWLIVLRRKTG